MFDSSLSESREHAAVLALMARSSPATWTSKRLAGAIEEAGSGLRLLEALENAPPATLFEVEDERYTLHQMEEYIRRLEREGIELITVLDGKYPANLRSVHDRPAALFVRGRLDADADQRSVAVVGTRNASEEGLDVARAVTEELIATDYVIVSGLAAGIDTAAHTAALGADSRTVAVIGTGIRVAFPAANAALQEQIASQGAVISGFWPGQEPRRWTFPHRNALMSGLARATVVIEASDTSGARMQARLAREHGRPVFLLRGVLKHRWARSAERLPGTYVVDSGAEVAEHLERLYEAPLRSTG